MLLYAEHCPEVNQRNGNLLPETVVNTLVGFRSNYSFLETDAKQIIRSKSSKGLNQYKVASNVFNMDFDNGVDSAKEACLFFKEKNIGYSLYNSGSKGVHLCVPTKETISEHLPMWHKIMAQKLNFGLDMSIYKHGSLFRLPGTIHQKTGRPKELLEVFKGRYIMGVLQSDVEPKKLQIDLEPLTDLQALRWGLHDIAKYMFKCPDNGDRHISLWKLSRKFQDAGLSYECALELMLNVNRSWGDRCKSDEEVRVAVVGAFTYVK